MLFSLFFSSKSPNSIRLDTSALNQDLGKNVRSKDKVLLLILILFRLPPLSYVFVVYAGSELKFSQSSLSPEPKLTVIR